MDPSRVFDFLAAAFAATVYLAALAGAIGYLSRLAVVRKFWRRAFGEPTKKWADKRIIEPIRPSLDRIEAMLAGIRESQDDLGGRVAVVQAEAALLRSDHDALEQRVRHLEDDRIALWDELRSLGRNRREGDG